MSLITDVNAAINRATIPFDKLPAPTVIEPLDFETVFAEVKADIIRYNPEMAGVLELESEPLTKLAQAFAYRIVQERSRANEKARHLLLAKALGPELDHIGALPWVLTPRKVIVAEDLTAIPPTQAEYETDDVYRARLQLALEGWSTAGPTGAYQYHALRSNNQVKDVGIGTPLFSRSAIPADVVSQFPLNSFVLFCEDDAGIRAPATTRLPKPGDVVIAVLSNIGDGTATAELCQSVENYLSADNLRPTNDRPIAIPATIIHYTVVAEIICYPGPDRTLVINQARAALVAYCQAHHHCGHDITRSGIHRALHQEGVQNVIISEPPADIIVDWKSAAYCNTADDSPDITLTDGGVDV